MTDQSENLVLEILRRIQADVADLKQAVRSVKDEVIAVRVQLHGMQGDTLRQEQNIAALAVDIDRIKARLNLADA